MIPDALDVRVPALGEVRCRDCGRSLRDPTSRAREVGPDCWGKGHTVPAQRRGMGQRAVPSTGQQELPLELRYDGGLSG